MTKRLLAIYLVLVVLIALLVPSCGPTTGTINVNATLCGNAWQGAVNYTLTGPTTISGTAVSQSFSVAPGNWNCGNVSGGPAKAFLKSITPSATQSVSKGETKTFTLNFELNQDAAIIFATWSINGQPYGGSDWQGAVCQIIDAHFKQWVNGCTGYNVTLNETSWLTITQTAGPAGGAMIVVVNDDCAVNKTPTPQGLPAVKKSQVPSVNNATVQKGQNFTIMPQPTIQLDVKTQWQLVKGTNYTKAINWFGISKAVQGPVPVHNCTLFELVLIPGAYTFQLMASASVALVGSTDVNPANNDAVSLFPLTLFVNVV